MLLVHRLLHQRVKPLQPFRRKANRLGLDQRHVECVAGSRLRACILRGRLLRHYLKCAQGKNAARYEHTAGVSESEVLHAISS
jgi:hypothetical protein